MRAGMLRHPIIIQTETETNTGGVTTSIWSTFASVRASADPLSATERWTAEQVQDETNISFRVRYLDGVTQKMRILYNYKAYNITGIIDMRGRGREMLLYASVYPQEYATFQYSNMTISIPEANNSALCTWDTDFYSSSNVRYKKSGAANWTYKHAVGSEADRDPRVLEHEITITGLDASSTYLIQFYGNNGAGWSPSWGTQGTFITDEDGKPTEETVIS